MCPSWDKDRSKINKQGCGLARKGHGDGVIVCSNHSGMNLKADQSNA